MSNRNHWANIAESGSILGMRILLLAYRIGGNFLLKIFLVPVITFFFITKPIARKASFNFLNRAHLKGSNIPKPKWWHSFLHLWQFGLSILDKFAVWLDRIPDQNITISGIELIDELVAQKKGGVIFISHLGNFEICQSLSSKHPGIKLTAFHHSKNSKKFNDLLNQYNEQNQAEILQVTEIDATTAIKVSEKIGRGEFVAIAGDRIPVDNHAGTLCVDFMDKPARLPKGPFALANALKAPVLFLTCLKFQSTYHVTFELLGKGLSTARKDRTHNIQALANSFAERLEHYALTAPKQWFNFYPFWSEKPESSLQDDGQQEQQAS